MNYSKAIATRISHIVVLALALLMLSALPVASPSAEASGPLVTAGFAQNDPISRVGVAVGALEAYAADHGTFAVAGSGWRGGGQGWFGLESGASYTKSVAKALIEGGYLPAGEGWETSNTDLAIYRCRGHAAVFSASSVTVSAADGAAWQGCTQYPVDRLKRPYFEVTATVAELAPVVITDMYWSGDGAAVAKFSRGGLDIEWTRSGEHVETIPNFAHPSYFLVHDDKPGVYCVAVRPAGSNAEPVKRCLAHAHFAATAVSETSITLSWPAMNHDPDVNGVVVTVGGDLVALLPADAAEYTLVDLEPGTTYDVGVYPASSRWEHPRTADRQIETAVAPRLAVDFANSSVNYLFVRWGSWAQGLTADELASIKRFNVYYAQGQVDDPASLGLQAQLGADARYVSFSNTAEYDPITYTVAVTATLADGSETDRLPKLLTTTGFSGGPEQDASPPGVPIRWANPSIALRERQQVNATTWAAHIQWSGYQGSGLGSFEILVNDQLVAEAIWPTNKYRVPNLDLGPVYKIGIRLKDSSGRSYGTYSRNVSYDGFENPNGTVTPPTAPTGNPSTPTSPTGNPVVPSNPGSAEPALPASPGSSTGQLNTPNVIAGTIGDDFNFRWGHVIAAGATVQYEYRVLNSDQVEVWNSRNPAARSLPDYPGRSGVYATGGAAGEFCVYVVATAVGYLDSEPGSYCAATRLRPPSVVLDLAGDGGWLWIERIQPALGVTSFDVRIAVNGRTEPDMGLQDVNLSFGQLVNLNDRFGHICVYVVAKGDGYRNSAEGEKCIGRHHVDRPRLKLPSVSVEINPSGILEYEIVAADTDTTAFIYEIERRDANGVFPRLGPLNVGPTRVELGGATSYSGAFDTDRRPGVYCVTGYAVAPGFRSSGGSFRCQTAVAR